jgi:hypothetical protein
MSVLICIGAACGETDVVGPRKAVSTFTLTGTSSIDGTGIVINEFATRLGPNEECSEFVELRNDASGERSLGGWRLAVSGPGGAPALYVTIPVGIVLAPGCHLLIATQPSGLLRDAPSSCNLPDNGGLALMEPDGTVVDQVGMHSSGFHEGTPLQPFSISAARNSYARIASDTDQNARDFFFGPATPQNRFDDCNTR